MTHHKAPVLACEGSMKSDPCQYRSMVRDSCRGGEKGELKCSANAEGTALLPLPGIKVGHARLCDAWYDPAAKPPQEQSANQGVVRAAVAVAVGEGTCLVATDRPVQTCRWTGRTEGGRRPCSPSLSRSTRE